MKNRKFKSRTARPRPAPPAKAAPISKRPHGLPIVFEDSAIVVVNKPAGLPSVPVEGRRFPSALSVLTGMLARKRQKVFVVHRIDRFTSGLILFAKTPADQEKLIQQFLKHTPVREYQAVVRGVPKVPKGKLIHYLRRQGSKQTVSSKNDRGAARASLDYLVEKPLKNAALVRITLETGLQNQIRVQFARAGHPVIGDGKYAPAEAREKQISRAALHAAHLSFKHPRTGEQLSFNCPTPEDFQQLLESLASPQSANRRPPHH